MNEWIVAFDHPPTQQVGDSYAGQLVVDVVDGLNFIVVRVGDVGALKASALLDPAVRYLEWNNPFYGHIDFVPNDAKYNDAGHWGSKKIGAETAWDKTQGATSVKVAMIDTGLKKNHEEFSNRGGILQGTDFANNDNDPADEAGACGYHGTHTTGTAGAQINNAKGIAGLSQHTILPVKALKTTLLILCSGSTANLAKALKYAGDQGAHFSSNSWGGGGVSQALNDAITYAYDKGVTQVAAAGNDGPCTDCVAEPWHSNPSKVIIVACTTDADAQCDFSSEGGQVDVAAPGKGILSSCGGNANSYCTYDGTSMSTPHVAGTLALVKALHPSFTYADLDARIKATAKDLGAAGRDDDFGDGRIQAGQAVT
ncbi:MAG TPA: S8 family serine peptidase [Candidatus Thermoplasmatota archaeon]|jgi:subtilisin family serine protease|nr:S8 family serine peptidase [Candidatus Thermoplasmatota archaeon]